MNKCIINTLKGAQTYFCFLSITFENHYYWLFVANIVLEKSYSIGIKFNLIRTASLASNKSICFQFIVLLVWTAERIKKTCMQREHLIFKNHTKIRNRQTYTKPSDFFAK